MKPRQSPTPRGWTGGSDDFEILSKQEGHIVGNIGFASKYDCGEDSEDEDQGPGYS